jgi:medium-chain acyl-[acyl-carrier-protein] hydrolase
MVPVAEVPPQDARPWRDALGRLLTDRGHWEEIARESRKAALEYANRLDAGAFEGILRDVVAREKRTEWKAGREAAPELSDEKRKLLAVMLRKRAPASSWFPGIDTATMPRLFWFPHAGGGTNVGVPGVVAVRLPGREARMAEAPFERMKPLVEALANAIEGYLDQPFAFFGHSMGAVVAFELARELRRRGKALPRKLIVSAARAPQFRRNWTPPPAPPDEQLLRDLKVPEELAPAVLPSLRADTALYRNYVYADGPPFEFPILAYGGIDDPNIRQEHLDGWREQTTGAYANRIFNGGHFYLQEAAAEFRAALESDLA